MTHTTKSSNELKRSTLVTYAMPTFGEQMMLAPIWGILPVLYADNTTASLTTIGLVFMIARLFDAFTDPAIGYLTDITRTRFGARKPWIAAGTIISAISVWFLYQPSSHNGATYFLITSSLLFLGWTMMTIPYNAWAGELSGDYQERSKLFAYRNTFGAAGGMLFVISPLYLMHWTGSTEFTLDVLAIVATFLIIFLPLSVGVALFATPQGTAPMEDRPSMKGIFTSLKQNKVMWLFITATILSGIVQGLFASLLFLYHSSYLKLGAYVPLLGAIQYGLILVTIPLWLKLVGRHGKHKAWAISSFGFLLLVPIFLLVEPGEGALYPMIIAAVILGLLHGALSVSPQSMLTDIIDLDTLKSGVNRAGSYFSLLTLLSKITTALGAGIGLSVVGLIGYDQNGPNDGMVIAQFLMIFTIVPAIIYVINGIIILKYPLEKHRQSIIRKRLDQRLARTQITP